MSLFRKKKEEKEMVKEQSNCTCVGTCNEENVEAVKETLSSGASVKVLGSGCDKCNALEKNVKEALSELEREELLVTMRSTGRTVTQDVEKIKGTKKTMAEREISRCMTYMRELGYSMEEIQNLIANYKA